MQSTAASCRSVNMNLYQIHVYSSVQIMGKKLKTGYLYK